MAGPTRFPNGVVNALPSVTFGNFGALDPSKYHCYFNDFDQYVAGDWTVTDVGSGTQALTDVDGGVLLLTTGATADTDHTYMQKVGESFLMAAGKKAWFKARMAISDATDTTFQVGLIITDTTPYDATDGIFFMKDDADTNIDFYCRKDASTGSNSTTAIATMADATYVSLGWYYDGVSTVWYFVDDVCLGHLDASSTYLPDTELTVSFAITNGASGAETLSVDYIFAAKER